jgi:selenide, water dikinase
LRHVESHSDPAVLVGLDAPDDAGVYAVAPGVALVQTVDFFTPVVDDPFDWGRIAAANALSDVYAMAGRPVTAMNLVGWPRRLDLELLGRVLEGSGSVCADAGVAIIGGHSVDDPEPKFGLAVTGIADPEQIVTKDGGRAGDALVLTKPLGTGIISSAIKEGAAPPEVVRRAVDSMTALNRDPAETMVRHGATAATDVTGFGLVGHLLQMLGGDLSAEVDVTAVPLLQGVLELAERGILPGGSVRNREATAPATDAEGVPDLLLSVLNDAQTSGGLLISVHQEAAAELVAELRRAAAPAAAVIGRLVPGDGGVRMRAG